MSIFTSFPVALGTLMYGRARGYTAVALAWVLSAVISGYVLNDPSLLVFYTASVFVTVAVAEVALRNVAPMKGIVLGGVALCAIVFGSTYAGFRAADIDAKSYLAQLIEENKPNLQEGLKQQTGEANNNAFNFLALLEDPEALAEQILREAPVYIIIGVFATLWVNVFMLLKSKRTLLRVRKPFTDRDLVQYKNPEHLIWVVIGALLLAVFGDQINEDATLIGVSALKVLGLFYFFQGFGLYVSFLDYMRLGGLLRSILVVATVMTANQVLALVGLFDMFVNFRRFMIRKDQGE